MWHEIRGHLVEGITGNDSAMESRALMRRPACKRYEVVLNANGSVNARWFESVTRHVGYDSAGIGTIVVAPQWEARAGKMNNTAAKVIEGGR